VCKAFHIDRCLAWEDNQNPGEKHMFRMGFAATLTRSAVIPSLVSSPLLFVLVFCAVMSIASSAQTFTTLVNFDGTNGSEPYSVTLIQGTDGNLYGTTSGGGVVNHHGTVFKMTLSGTLTTIYTFCVQPKCADGSLPSAGLVQATDGNFYGTTYLGGHVTAKGPCASGCGTVFRITPGGALTTLHSFHWASDGGYPSAALLQAADGNFYGTTYGGGRGKGTIFKMTPAGALTLLYSFCSQYRCFDGDRPLAALIQASDGNLYGTASGGGYGGAGNGHGTTFKITTGGAFTVLYAFCQNYNPQNLCYKDGGTPEGALVQASNGNFYGTTSFGGFDLNGTVFEMSQTGFLQTVATFCTGAKCDGGYSPYAGMIMGKDGNFYGASGSAVYRFVFSLTTLHSFSGPDGSNLTGGVVQASDGSLYGTTSLGGTNNLGTVFRVTLAPGAY
jgi:uncharacterized repeat protein (TIGR03803 family)